MGYDWLNAAGQQYLSRVSLSGSEKAGNRVVSRSDGVPVVGMIPSAYLSIYAHLTLPVYVENSFLFTI